MESSLENLRESDNNGSEHFKAYLFSVSSYLFHTISLIVKLKINIFEF